MLEKLKAKREALATLESDLLTKADLIHDKIEIVDEMIEEELSKVKPAEEDSSAAQGKKTIEFGTLPRSF